MLISVLLSIINYDIKLYLRKGGEAVTALGFLLIATAFLPLSLDTGSAFIQNFAPAFIWIIALLASLLSIPYIFQRDYLDGTLDQLKLSPLAFEWCVLAKCIANWMGCQLPLILLSPVCGLLLGMETEQTARMAFSLLIGTPVLCCIGALGSALTLGASGKSGLLAVIVLPLYIPLLVFATALASSNTAQGAFAGGEAALLIGLSCAALPLSCWAAAAIVKLHD